MLREIGIRAAKGRFSELLRDIRKGRSWIITERGLPVARLVPFMGAPASLAERIQASIARGVMDAPQTKKPFQPPIKVPDANLQRLLAEDRAD